MHLLIQMTLSSFQLHISFSVKLFITTVYFIPFIILESHVLLDSESQTLELSCVYFSVCPFHCVKP